MVGNSGCKSRVQCVNIKTDKYRAIKIVANRCDIKVFYFMDLNTEAFDLLAQVRIQGTDTNLDNASGQAIFQDARKRAGMRIRVSLKVIVQIRMGVEMQDIYRAVGAVNGPHYGEGYCVVTTQYQWQSTTFDNRADMRFYRQETLRIVGNLPVTHIKKMWVVGKINTQFLTEVRRPAMQGPSDELRCCCSPLHKAGIRVGHNPDQGDITFSELIQRHTNPRVGVWQKGILSFISLPLVLYSKVAVTCFNQVLLPETGRT